MRTDLCLGREEVHWPRAPLVVAVQEAVEIHEQALQCCEASGPRWHLLRLRWEQPICPVREAHELISIESEGLQHTLPYGTISQHTLCHMARFTTTHAACELLVGGLLTLQCDIYSCELCSATAVNFLVVWLGMHGASHTCSKRCVQNVDISDTTCNMSGL